MDGSQTGESAIKGWLLLKLGQLPGLTSVPDRHDCVEVHNLVDEVDHGSFAQRGQVRA